MEQYYPAQVINNNSLQHIDGQKDGRVQIYIPELYYGFTNDQYPWARQDRNLTSDIPEINDWVWVWFEDEIRHKKAFYGNKINFLESHGHGQTIGTMTAQYPYVKYWRYANGTAIAISSDPNTPEISINHPQAEIYIDKTGAISIKGGSASLEKMLLGETTKQLLSDILDAIKLITVTCAAPGSPSTIPLNSATFTSLKTQLTNILSAKNKNN